MAIGAGAQTCRPDDAGPVRDLLGGMTSPAAFFCSNKLRDRRACLPCTRVREPALLGSYYFYAAQAKF